MFIISILLSVCTLVIGFIIGFLIGGSIKTKDVVKGIKNNNKTDEEILEYMKSFK